MKSFRPDAAQLRALGLAVLLGIVAYMIYMGWGRNPAYFSQRPYMRCPETETLFESDTFGYTLCLPKHWEGRYTVENRDKSISFVHSIPNEKTFLFSVVSIPEAFWLESEDLRRNMQYIGKDDGRVFAASKADYIPPKSVEAAQFFAEVPRILQSMSFSPHKSIERVMEDYFEAQVAIRNRNGTVFSSMELLGRDEENGQIRYYAWVHAQEYLFRNGMLEKGAAMNLPAVFTIKPQTVGYTAAGFQAPRSGEAFTADLVRLFPERVVKSEWFSSDLKYHNEHVAILADIVRSKARGRFKIKAERRLGYIRSVSAEDGIQKITFDPVFWLKGQEAVVAMRAEGACEPLGPCEPKGGYYISNPDQNTETNVVAWGPEIILQGDRRPAYTEFLTAVLTDPKQFENVPFYFEMEDGKIVKLAEQYVP